MKNKINNSERECYNESSLNNKLIKNNSDFLCYLSNIEEEDKKISSSESSEDFENKIK